MEVRDPSLVFLLLIPRYFQNYSTKGAIRLPGKARRQQTQLDVAALCIENCRQTSQSHRLKDLRRSRYVKRSPSLTRAEALFVIWNSLNQMISWSIYC